MIFSIFVASAPLMANEIYEYKIKNLSEDAVGNDCEQRLEQFAVKVADQTGATIISKGCFPSELDAGYLDASLGYSAAAELKFTNMMDYGHTTLEDLGY